jgi:hypothetical protein
VPAIDEPQRTDEYVPTLLQYAEVIAWLDERRKVWIGTSPTMAMPEHLKRAYADAIRRESLGRVAKAMQAAEDEAVGWDLSYTNPEDDH